MPNPPRQYGSPGFQQPGLTSTNRPRPGAASPEEVHRRLDAYEAHLKNEGKRLKALRTLMPPRAVKGASGSAPRKTSVPGIDAAVDKMSR